MAAETWQIDSDDEAVQYATQIIKEEYPYLVETEILYFRIEKAGFRTKTQKASAQVNALTGAEVVITINDEEWRELDRDQRLAQMHWALAHIEIEEKKDGSLKLSLTPPTIQDFPEVVARHGSWQPEILEYVQKCEEGGKKLTENALSRKAARDGSDE